MTNRKAIEDDTQIDGGGLVTLSGGDATRIFIVVSGTTLALSNITLSDGSSFTGGAIINDGILTITNSTLSGNEVEGVGGAIYNDGTLTITNSTLNDNIASGGAREGGAIYNRDGTLIITSSTLSGNEARDGGAIYNFASLAITSSTLSGNEASRLGGAIYNGATATLQNSILANSTGGNCAVDAPSSLGYNLSDDDSCNLSPATNDLVNTEPLLDDLDDYGGPTQTHLPLPASPAIDKIPLASRATDDQGSILADQRGITRPQDGLCDIGSVELRNLPPTITTAVTATPNPVDEGHSTTVSVTATDPADDDDGTLSYAFDCDGTGSFEVGPQDSPQTTCSYLDDGMVTVNVRVSDSLGLTDTDSVVVTVTNVVPTIALSGASSVGEGSPYTLTLGEVTDPGQDTVTTYTVHWGDGTSETFNATGNVTHTYTDGPANATISVDLTDEDGTHLSAATHGPITIDNLPPAIDQLSATIDGDEIVVSVLASDPAGVLDPLTYAFDCDTSGDIDIGPQDASTARCPQAVLGATQLIRVVVKDGDGGMTEGFVSIAVDYALCAGWLSGRLREADESDCARGELSLSLPGDGPLSVCVGWVGGFMRAGEDCAWSGYALSLPEDGPLTVCVNPLSKLLRAPASRACAWYEDERVIGDR